MALHISSLVLLSSTQTFLLYWTSEYLNVNLLGMLWHMQRKLGIHRLCGQKQFAQWYSYRPKCIGFELPLYFLCCGGHIRKQMNAFSRLPLYSLKGRRKDVSSVAILWHQPRKWINRSKQQVKRICRPDTVWLFKWKEVNRILKEYIFIYSSVSFSFFHRHLKSTEWP